MAEIEAGWFERQLDSLGPEIQLVASAMAALAVEDVLADVDTEAGIGSILGGVERAGTTPLVTTNPERDIVQLFEHRTDGDQSAQSTVVEKRHVADLSRTWKRSVTRRLGRQLPRAGRVWHDEPDRTCL